MRYPAFVRVGYSKLRFVEVCPDSSEVSAVYVYGVLGGVVVECYTERAVNPGEVAEFLYLVPFVENFYEVRAGWWCGVFLDFDVTGSTWLSALHDSMPDYKLL